MKHKQMALIVLGWFMLVGSNVHAMNGQSPPHITVGPLQVSLLPTIGQLAAFRFGEQLYLPLSLMRQNQDTEVDDQWLLWQWLRSQTTSSFIVLPEANTPFKLNSPRFRATPQPTKVDK